MNGKKETGISLHRILIGSVVRQTGAIPSELTQTDDAKLLSGFQESSEQGAVYRGH